MSGSLRNIIEKVSNVEKIIIFGAGEIGQRVCKCLNKSGQKVYSFFDNNESKKGMLLLDTEIRIPDKMSDESTVYIIAANDSEVRKSMYEQLIGLGISKQQILYYYDKRTYDYLKELPKDKYKEEISNMFFDRLAREMNWECPQTFNEIINWAKINEKDSRKTKLADKYLVREWVKEQIGEEYLTKQYGYWDDPYEINFDKLPEKYVLKLNNGSDRNIIVNNRDGLDLQRVREQLNEWKGKNYAYQLLEMHYKDIVPKIICEEYLDGLAENEYDYNIYCFHGEPFFIHCIKGSHRLEQRTSCYDLNWKRLPFNFIPPFDEEEVAEPNNLRLMLELTKKLCKDFDYVRVDWYDLSHKGLLFSEITFSPWGGFGEWVPEEYDMFFGKLIQGTKK